jgi:hypothetical protein
MPDTPAVRAAMSDDRIVQQIVIVTDDIRIASTDCEEAEWEGGTSSAEIAAALVARDGLTTTEPGPLAVGGLTGLQLDVGLQAGWAGTCPQDPTTPAVPLVGTVMAEGDNRYRVIVLDRPDRGNIAILLYAHYAADFDAFVRDAMPIVESFEFDLTP